MRLWVMHTWGFIACRVFGAACLGAACLGAACLEEGWVLPEADAVAIVRAELSARGVEADVTTRVAAPIDVCLSGRTCRTIAVALDGWDDDARVGFAYLSAHDRAGQPSGTALERDEADALQATLDTRTATEGIVVVFREWSHETEGLARDQFTGAVRQALTDHGVAEAADVAP